MVKFYIFIFILFILVYCVQPFFTRKGSMFYNIRWIYYLSVVAFIFLYNFICSHIFNSPLIVFGGADDVQSSYEENSDVPDEYKALLDLEKVNSVKSYVVQNCIDIYKNNYTITIVDHEGNQTIVNPDLSDDTLEYSLDEKRRYSTKLKFNDDNGVLESIIFYESKLSSGDVYGLVSISCMIVLIVIIIAFNISVRTSKPMPKAPFIILMILIFLLSSYVNKNYFNTSPEIEIGRYNQ